MSDSVLLNEIQVIENFLKEKIGKKRAVIGISGGIDSSLVLTLLSNSIPVSNIMPFFLPEKRTPESDFRDVETLCKSLSIPYETIFIDPISESFKKVLKPPRRELDGNIKARVRMTILYEKANENDGLVIGTTNYSEYMTGYFTKYGDGACDIEPILHLKKSDVRKLAALMRVPESILSKKPSAGLWEGQSDEEEMGITYDEIDRILSLMDSGKTEDNDTYRKVEEMVRVSFHKRIQPENLLSQRK